MQNFLIGFIKMTNSPKGEAINIYISGNQNPSIVAASGSLHQKVISKFVLGLIFFLFTVLIQSCTSLSPELSSEKYIKAMDTLKSGNVDQAFSYLNESIDANPDMYKAYYSRAAIYDIYFKQPDKAIIDLEKTIELNPEFAPAYHLLGKIYSQTKDFQNSEIAFSSAIGIEPGIKEHYFYRGKARIELKNYNGAISDFEKCISIDPHFGFALLEAGNCYLKTGRAFDAIKALDSAEAYGAGNIDKTFEYRGLSRYFVNDFEGAAKDFSKAFELNPKNTTAIFNRANVYSVLGKVDEAIEDFSTNIELEPDSPLLYYSRGNRYHIRKKYIYAIDDFKKALELKPGYEEVYLNMAYSYFAIGKIDNTEKCLDSVLVINPWNNEALEMKGMLLRETNRPNESFKLLEKAIEHDPEYALFYFEIALTWNSILLHDKAIENMKIFVERARKLARLRGKLKEGESLLERWTSLYQKEE